MNESENEYKKEIKTLRSSQENLKETDTKFEQIINDKVIKLKDAEINKLILTRK